MFRRAPFQPGGDFCEREFIIGAGEAFYYGVKLQLWLETIDGRVGELAYRVRGKFNVAIINRPIGAAADAFSGRVRKSRIIAASVGEMSPGERFAMQTQFAGP